MRDSVRANLSGMFAVIVAQGLLLSFGFWFIGVHSPVLWGMIGGLASIVPVVGAFLIWAPVVIAYVLDGAYGQALFLVIWGSLIVGSADNVLRPWIVGKRNEIHPMLIALAAIGGTYAFGALGILLGPLLVSFAAVSDTGNSTADPAPQDCRRRGRAAIRCPGWRLAQQGGKWSNPARPKRFVR